MKTAVIIGIVQMTFGLVLKLCNAMHFKSKIDMYAEALPQLIFMVTLFGYMIFLIVLKWCIDWTNPLTAPGEGEGEGRGWGGGRRAFVALPPP